MQVVRPMTVTESMLVSSTIPEPDTARSESVWNSATAYVAGDEVIRTQTHRRYEAIDATTNEVPEDNPEVWLDIGPTNRFAMFDNVISTRSVDDDAYPEIVVRVQQEWIDTVALFGVFGDGFVEVKVFAADGVTQIGDTQIREMEISRNITDMWRYLTEPFTFLSEMLFRGLPIGYRNIVEVRLVSVSLAVEVGEIIFGVAQDLGSTEIGLRIGIEDFSRKEVDAFGNATLIPRRFAKLVNATCEVPNSGVNAVVGTLFDLRATPVVWVPTTQPELSATIVYGFYRDFYVTVAYHTHSLCQLEIEGIT